MADEMPSSTTPERLSQNPSKDAYKHRAHRTKVQRGYGSEGASKNKETILYKKDTSIKVPKSSSKFEKQETTEHEHGGY